MVQLGPPSVKAARPARDLTRAASDSSEPEQHQHGQAKVSLGDDAPHEAKNTQAHLSKKGDVNETVYRKIKELILSGRLRPGVRLVHQDLADQLAVSRTPVRESLERLFQEGYAGRWPRRGYFVAELDASEVEALYETREALELFALRKTCGRGFTQSEISELRALNDTYGTMFPESISRRRLQVDHQFHTKLAGLAGNDFLCSTLDIIFEKTSLKRRMDGQGLIVGNKPLHDHQALVTAIEKRHYKEAEEVLQSHIREASLRLLRHLELNASVLPD